MGGGFYTQCKHCNCTDYQYNANQTIEGIFEATDQVIVENDESNPSILSYVKQCNCGHKQEEHKHYRGGGGLTKRFNMTSGFL